MIGTVKSLPSSHWLTIIRRNISNKNEFLWRGRGGEACICHAAGGKRRWTSTPFSLSSWCRGDDLLLTLVNDNRRNDLTKTGHVRRFSSLAVNKEKAGGGRNAKEGGDMGGTNIINNGTIKTKNASLSSSQMNHLTKVVFQTQSSSLRRHLRQHIDNHINDFTPSNILSLLYSAAIKRYILPVPMLQQLVQKLYEFPPEEMALDIAPHMIRKGFYGLRCYSVFPSYPQKVMTEVSSSSSSASRKRKKVPQEVMGIIDYLTKCLLAHPQRLSGESVSLILYGIQGLDSEDEAVRRLLHVVSHKLDRHAVTCAFTAVELSNCFYGLKSMSCVDVEVVRLLRVLAAEVDKLEEVMKPVDIANSFYGLNRMTSYSKEVRLVVSSLTRCLEQCEQPLSCRRINNILYGMQGMLGKDAEVAHLVDVLATVVQRSLPHVQHHEINSQDLAMMGYGIKELDSKHPEVRRLVFSLTQLLDRACNVRPEHEEEKGVTLHSRSGLLDPRALGTCLLGMKNMSSEHEEVREYLSIVMNKARQGAEGTGQALELKGREIANGFMGLRHMSTEHDVVFQTMTFLTNQLDREVKQTGQPGDIYSAPVMSKLGAALAIHGMRGVARRHSDLRNHAVTMFVKQLELNKSVMGQPPSSDMQALVFCFNGLTTEDNSNGQLLKWLHGELELAVTNKGQEAGDDGVVLTLDMIRNMASGLSRVETVSEEGVGVWTILCQQFSAIMKDAELFPSHTVCHFALCDLLESLRGMRIPNRQFEAGNSSGVGYEDLVGKWCDSLTIGFRLAGAVSDTTQHPRVPLNWLLRCLGGLAHKTGSSFGEDSSLLIASYTGLVDELAKQLEGAGPSFDHPYDNIPLSLCCVLDAARGIQNLLYFLSACGSDHVHHALPTVMTKLRESTKLLLVNVMNKVEEAVKETGADGLGVEEVAEMEDLLRRIRRELSDNNEDQKIVHQLDDFIGVMRNKS